MEFSKYQKNKITNWYCRTCDYEVTQKLLEKMESKSIKEYLYMCNMLKMDIKMVDKNIKRMVKKMFRV